MLYCTNLGNLFITGQRKSACHLLQLATARLHFTLQATWKVTLYISHSTSWNVTSQDLAIIIIKLYGLDEIGNHHHNHDYHDDHHNHDYHDDHRRISPISIKLAITTTHGLAGGLATIHWAFGPDYKFFVLMISNLCMMMICHMTHR